MQMGRFGAILVALFLKNAFVFGQAGLSQYALFEIKEKELVWQCTYQYSGNRDSIKHAAVQMLKSKFYTFNVVRNEEGYNGELRHYKVDCKKYDRTYLNTPRMYWDGEWTGKFTLEVADNSYRVTVYALYYEKIEQSTGYYRTEKTVKGRYLDAVTTKKKTFREKELANLVLMSQSLKFDFDVVNTTVVKD